MIHSLVILGATGDLTGRYLMPALARLVQLGVLPIPFRIVGLSCEGWDRAQFRDHVAKQLNEHSDADIDSHARLLGCLEYRAADVTDRRAVASAVKALAGPVAAYLALPSALFVPAIEALSPALPAGSRMVVEKPFGESLESARALNRLLHRTFPEEAVFRIDHFLGMQTVQSLLGLRFANRLFEPIWSHHHVEQVELVWDETLALEGRASYYDRAGALRDMIQNHLLQLLCLVGMEPPLSLGEHDLRDRKVDALRAVERLSPEDVDRRTVRGRYGAGRIGDRTIPAYVDEPGINPARATETFAQVTLHINNWRWAGVPFLLRTGKALGRNRQSVPSARTPFPSALGMSLFGLAFTRNRTCTAVRTLRKGTANAGAAGDGSARKESPGLFHPPGGEPLPSLLFVFGMADGRVVPRCDRLRVHGSSGEGYLCVRSPLPACFVGTPQNAAERSGQTSVNG